MPCSDAEKHALKALLGQKRRSWMRATLLLWSQLVALTCGDGSSVWAQSLKSLRKEYMRGGLADQFYSASPSVKYGTGARFTKYLHGYGFAALLNTSFQNPEIKGWTNTPDERGELRSTLMYLDRARAWPVYSETVGYCAVLFQSGRAVGAHGALVVEQGTLFGASSRCLAAGMTAGADGRRQLSKKSKLADVYMAFDDFSLFPRRAMVASGFDVAKNPLFAASKKAFEKGIPYDDVVWQQLMVGPVYSGPTLTFPGDIAKRTTAALSMLPATVPVEVWSIDSAKGHSQFIEQSKAIWPRLRQGSVIHLMDFGKHQSVFWLVQFVLSGDVSISFISPGSAPWSFVVERAPLDWNKVVTWCNQTQIEGQLPSNLQVQILKVMNGVFDRAGLPDDPTSIRRYAIEKYTRVFQKWHRNGECGRSKGYPKIH